MESFGKFSLGSFGIGFYDSKKSFGIHILYNQRNPYYKILCGQKLKQFLVSIQSIFLSNIQLFSNYFSDPFIFGYFRDKQRLKSQYDLTGHLLVLFGEQFFRAYICWSLFCY